MFATADFLGFIHRLNIWSYQHYLDKNVLLMHQKPWYFFFHIHALSQERDDVNYFWRTPSQILILVRDK